MLEKGRRKIDVFGVKFVSHTHKFIYFAVPKTGTGSLLNIFREHASLTKLKGRYSFLDYPDYAKCAFVRNPWDRTLSCYLSKIKKDESFENVNFEKGVMKKFHNFNVFYAGMPFDEFLAGVDNIPDDIADGHFASQYNNVVMDGEIVVDFLGRFENFEAEATRFLRMVGINKEIEFPLINESKDRKPYPEYYDEKTRKIVERRFKKDIELFGYHY